MLKTSTFFGPRRAGLLIKSFKTLSKVAFPYQTVRSMSRLNDKVVIVTGASR